MESTVNWQQLIIDMKGSLDRIDERTKLEFDRIDKRFEDIDVSIKGIEKDVREINEKKLPKFVTKETTYACAMLVVALVGAIAAFF